VGGLACENGKVYSRGILSRSDQLISGFAQVKGEIDIIVVLSCYRPIFVESPCNGKINSFVRPNNTRHHLIYL